MGAFFAITVDAWGGFWYNVVEIKLGGIFMICSKCGNYTPDGFNVCSVCGALLEAPTPQQPVQQQPVQQPVQPAAPVAPPPVAYVAPPVNSPLSTHPVLNTLKTLGSSPLLLVAIIAFSAALVFSLINAFVTPAIDLSALGLSGLGYAAYELREVLDILNTVIIVFTVIGMIPSILMALGMWLTYAAASNRQDNGMKTTGLTLVQTGTIITMVTTILLLGILSIVALVLAAAASEVYYMEDTVPLFIGLFFGLLIGLALCIVYYVFVLNAIKSVKTTAKTGVPTIKAIMFVAVLAIIGGAGNFISVFSADGVVGVISSLLSATANILFGVVLLSYRSKMQAMAPAQPLQPVYQQPVQVAQPVYQPVQQPVYQPPVQATQPVQVAAPVATAPAPTATAYCTGCGQALAADQVFCPNCGAKRS